MGRHKTRGDRARAVAYDFFNRQPEELKFDVSCSKQSRKKISIANPARCFRYRDLRGTRNWPRDPEASFLLRRATCASCQFSRFSRITIHHSLLTDVLIATVAHSEFGLNPSGSLISIFSNRNKNSGSSTQCWRSGLTPISSGLPPAPIGAVGNVAQVFRPEGRRDGLASKEASYINCRQHRYILIADPRLEMRVTARKINGLKISNRLKTGGCDSTKAKTTQNRQPGDPSVGLRASWRSQGATTHHSPLTNHESSGLPCTLLTHPHPGPTLHPAFGPQLKILEE